VNRHRASILHRRMIPHLIAGAVDDVDLAVHQARETDAETENRRRTSTPGMRWAMNVGRHGHRVIGSRVLGPVPCWIGRIAYGLPVPCTARRRWVWRVYLGCGQVRTGYVPRAPEWDYR
jgi:hypothetical protein